MAPRRLGAGRQRLARLGQALAHLRAREVDVDRVAEHGRHLREAVARERARRLEAGDAREGRLDRERDLLLDLERRERRGERVDLHLVVGDVRDGVDRQVHERPRAHDRRRQREQEHDLAPVDREPEDGFEHGSA